MSLPRVFVTFFVPFFVIFVPVSTILTLGILGVARQRLEIGYRQGCIDAMTGKPGYVLTTQPNGETVWAVNPHLPR